MAIIGRNAKFKERYGQSFAQFESEMIKTDYFQ